MRVGAPTVKTMIIKAPRVVTPRKLNSLKRVKTLKTNPKRATTTALSVMKTTASTRTIS